MGVRFPLPEPVCTDDLDVRIEYQPEGTNNSDSELVFREFLLRPAETRVFASIIEAIPGLADDELSGSVRIESASDSGCKVLSVSRTFNDTPDGSLGLFVPALPVKRGFEDFLDLTGLIQNGCLPHQSAAPELRGRGYLGRVGRL